MTLTEVAGSRLSSVPGSVVIARIRRLIVRTVVVAIGYAVVTNAMRIACPGGFAGDGRFVDAHGDVTSAAPQCITATLAPSAYALIGMAVVVLWSLSRVLNSADSTASAVRILDRATRAVTLLGVACAVISHVWFSVLPFGDWNGLDPFTYFLPFPFGAVTVEIAPQPN
jgi:hypothetical protein